MTDEQAPTEHVPRFTRDDIRRRFIFLSERCERYISDQNRFHPTWRLKFDHLVLLNVAQSTLDDIWRYKVYHLRDQNKRSDAVKRAAFFTKWIARLHPVYFDRIFNENAPEATVDKNDKSLLANEAFAIHVSLTTLATETGLEEIILDPDYFANFLYDLHYREISEDALLHIYDTIRNTAEGHSILLR